MERDKKLNEYSLEVESWVWRFHSSFPFVSSTSFDERTQSNSTEPFRSILKVQKPNLRRDTPGN